MNEVEKILVILYHLNTIKGRTRLQKLFYLLKNKNQLDIDYNFIPYHYGPYSQDLQLDINLLEAADYIQVDHQEDNLYVHLLTDRGIKAVNRILTRMTESDIQNITQHLDEYKDIPTKTLILNAKELAGMLT